MNRIAYPADDYKTKINSVTAVRKNNSENSSSSSNKTGNYIVFALSIFIIAIMTYNIWRSISQTTNKLEIIDYAEIEVQNLRLQNIDLVMEKEKMKKDDFVELEARDRLNYARDEETICVFSEGINNRIEGEYYVNSVLDKGVVLGEKFPENCDQICVLKEWALFFIEGM